MRAPRPIRTMAPPTATSFPCPPNGPVERPAKPVRSNRLLGDGKHHDRSCGAHHSTTLSARSSSLDGILRPSAFAVFRLMTSANLVGCSTGKSPGFAPFKILSTNTAARRCSHDIGTIGHEATAFGELGGPGDAGKSVVSRRFGDLCPPSVEGAVGKHDHSPRLS